MITDEPAVNGWQAANEAHMARSTSAELRQVTAELDRVRADYDTVLLDRDQLARREADLEQALTNAGRELIAERQQAETFRTDRDQAWAEVARLRAQVRQWQQSGLYELTDQGLAATETTKEQP